MLARSSFRAASRAAFRPAAAIRTFKTTPRQNDPETVSEDRVPVSHYHQGQRHTDEVKVDHTNQPVAPPGEDVESKAIPLQKSVLDQLTPTLRKFTCPDKVAVITGYVIPQFLRSPAQIS